MPCLPEARAVLGRDAHSKFSPPFRRRSAGRTLPAPPPRIGCREFEEQGRALGQRRLAEAVDGGQCQCVEQFDAGDRNTHLDGLDDGGNCGIDVREGADGGGHRLRHRIELHGEFGDDAERPFRADEEAGQVVAGRGLFARLPVWMMRPSARTTVIAITFSRIVP